MFSTSITGLLILMVFSLVSVAFITLLERKILGYMQYRIGPNKVGLLGILQPFSDAVKLYTKEISWPFLVNSLPFFISPLVSLILSIFIWISLPMYSSILSLKFSVLVLLAVLSLGVYPILLGGWSSNSMYSSLGSMRSLAQTISYEVSLVFIILSVIFMTTSLNLKVLSNLQESSIFMMFLVSFILWTISVMAELNRTPFDFAEGESELVSGFNTEFSSAPFAIIFMAEYLMILFFSLTSSLLFFFSNFSMFQFMMLSLFMFLFIWVRATLPRYRYDKLMNLCWKTVLPLSIMNLSVMTMFMIFSL